MNEAEILRGIKIYDYPPRCLELFRLYVMYRQQKGSCDHILKITSSLPCATKTGVIIPSSDECTLARRNHTFLNVVTDRAGISGIIRVDKQRLVPIPYALTRGLPFPSDDLSDRPPGICVFCPIFAIAFRAIYELVYNMEYEI